MEGSNKWAGIAAGPDNMLYCCPCNASVVLVIDPINGTCSTIPCGVAGDYKWTGIALGPDDKLYCAPNNTESGVRVIDPATRTCSTIPCGVKGTHRWWSIAEGPAGTLAAPCANGGGASSLAALLAACSGRTVARSTGHQPVPDHRARREQR